MDERRDDQPPPETRRARISPGFPPLTQQARSDYNEHVGTCARCRDIDRDRCPTGNMLWRDWNAACDDAFRRLGSEIRRT